MQKLNKPIKMVSVKFYKEDLELIEEDLKRNRKEKLSSWLREFLHKQLENDLNKWKEYKEISKFIDDKFFDEYFNNKGE